jgi:hypothetical protein
MGVYGNDAVVSTLEALLTEAKRGQASYLIAALLTHGVKPMAGTFGSPAIEDAAVRAGEELVAIMKARVHNHMLPPRDLSIGADHVCYNVASGSTPLSYDFLIWLMDQEMTRLREKAPAPLKVHFWMGHDGRGSFDLPGRWQMFEHVMRPALGLIGAVENRRDVGGRFKNLFTSKDIVAAARCGEKVPHFHVPVTRPISGPAPVTITLRETNTYTYRNSNLAAWLALATELQKQGERVVIVRDTAKAHKPLKGFTTYPPASINLHLRTALYEQAKINLFTSNGPSIIGYFINRPALCFQPIEDENFDYEPYRPSYWPKHFGIEVGEQWPWCRPDQRIVWAKDDYANLIQAWNEIREVL